MRSLAALPLLLVCACSGPIDGESGAPSRAPSSDLESPLRATNREPWLPRELAGARFFRSDVARDRIEQDLELVFGAGDGTKYIDDDEPEIDIYVFNRSEQRSYPVVLSGDGSEMGWREPELRVQVEMRIGDKWMPAPVTPTLRCGNFDSEWQNDVRLLGPGESAKLEWVRMPYVDLYGAEEVRLTAAYAYAAGLNAKRFGSPTTIPDALANTPPFKLVSRPMTLRNVRTMRLDVSPIDITRLARGAPLERAFRASLENLTITSQMLATGGRLHLEVVAKDKASLDGDPEHITLDLLAPADAPEGRDDVMLEPARPMSVTAGRAMRASDEITSLGFDWDEVVRWRVSYDGDFSTAGGTPRSRDIASNWFDVRGRRVEAPLVSESPSRASP